MLKTLRGLGKKDKQSSSYTITWKSPDFPLHARVKLLPNVKGLGMPTRYRLLNIVGTVIRGEGTAWNKDDEANMRTRTPVDFDGEVYFLKSGNLERII